MDNAQQQIVDTVKSTSNILVTVSTNPSVDELSAALGLTILLNKIDKRATAIFSGLTPPAITFLEPDKTFENSADSLRDFIIALDKEKADHLRYKVDGDAVKIFITPYKTTLSQADLEFSQGDYNVELVLALGVTDQEHLDKALEAHGKILHDAKVMTITSGETGSKLGSLDWHDGAASSLSEMIVALADGLKGGEPVFDEQISTALLTGIVSATDRFSNNHTTSKVMTMAAQLMAAGANQQLISAKLEEAHDIGGAVASSPLADSDNTDSAPGSELIIERSDTPSSPSEPQVDEFKEQNPASTVGEKIIEPLPEPEPEPTPPVVSNEDNDQLELEKQLAGINGGSAPTGTMEDIEKELKDAVAEASAPDNGPLTAVSDSAMPGFEAPEIASIVPVDAVAAFPPQAITPEPTPEIEPEVPALPPMPEFPPELVAPPEPPAPPQELALPPEPPIEAIPPQIINQHGSMSTTAPEGTQPMNSVGSDDEPTVDPFGMPSLPNEGQSVGGDSVGTAEGAAMLTSDPLPTLTHATEIPAGVPELPALPPLPPDLNMPPLPPPPPPPPSFSQPGGAIPSGAVSGDVFGDSGATLSPLSDPVPTAVASEPGQFKIPGQ